MAPPSIRDWKSQRGGVSLLPLISVALLLIPLQKSAMTYLSGLKRSEAREDEKRISFETEDLALQRLTQLLQEGVLFYDLDERTWMIMGSDGPEPLDKNRLTFYVCDPRKAEPLGAPTPPVEPVYWSCSSRHRARVVATLLYHQKRAKIRLDTRLHTLNRFTRTYYRGAVLAVKRKKDEKK